jgi:hypothetical protein
MVQPYVPRSQLRLYGIQLNRRNLRRMIRDEERNDTRTRAEVEHALAPRHLWEMRKQNGIHGEAEFIRALDNIPSSAA